MLSFLFFQLLLAKIGQQGTVASVPVDQDDLLDAVPVQFVAGFLENAQHQLGAVGHRAGLLPGWPLFWFLCL